MKFYDAVVIGGGVLGCLFITINIFWLNALLLTEIIAKNPCTGTLLSVHIAHTRLGDKMPAYT